MMYDDFAQEYGPKNVFASNPNIAKPSPYAESQLKLFDKYNKKGG